MYPKYRLRTRRESSSWPMLLFIALVVAGASVLYFKAFHTSNEMYAVYLYYDYVSDVIKIDETESSESSITVLTDDGYYAGEIIISEAVVFKSTDLFQAESQERKWKNSLERIAHLEKE